MIVVLVGKPERRRRMRSRPSPSNTSVLQLSSMRTNRKHPTGCRSSNAPRSAGALDDTDYRGEHGERQVHNSAKNVGETRNSMPPGSFLTIGGQGCNRLFQSHYTISVYIMR